MHLPYNARVPLGIRDAGIRAERDGPGPDGCVRLVKMQVGSVSNKIAAFPPDLG